MMFLLHGTLLVQGKGLPQDESIQYPMDLHGERRALYLLSCVLPLSSLIPRLVSSLISSHIFQSCY